MSQPRDHGFDQVAYLLSSARMALDEPVVYASFRLTEGASRTIGTLPPSDPFLAELRVEIENTKLRMINDTAGYAAWLDDVLRRVVAEAKRRNVPSYGSDDSGATT